MNHPPKIRTFNDASFLCINFLNELILLNYERRHLLNVHIAIENKNRNKDKFNLDL
jgi:hypothetical protein